MTYEFEGKTEKEAIEKAMHELGVERDNFDVEILEVQRGGLFKKGYVKIRLHTSEPGQQGAWAARSFDRGDDTRLAAEAPVNEELEKSLVEFLKTILIKMNTPGRVTVQSRERRKLTLNIDAQDSAIIIGKKGRTLDALQLIVTLYARKVHRGEIRITLDCENYRLHHEEALVRLALSVSAKVRSSRHSILLEPMNPYDRRVIHTTLDRSGDIETKSEGEGTYKQIRVSYRGRRD